MSQGTDPQNVNSGMIDPGVSGTLGQALETPQAAPAVGQAPDTSTLPPSPGQGSGTDPDYQALFEEERQRRQGLDRRLQQEATARQQLSMQLNQLQQQVAPEAPQEPSQPSPAPTQPQAPAQTDVLQQAINQQLAAQYRDNLLTQYEQQLGVPLSLFRDHIPAVPPVLGDGGVIDDSAQRAQIEAFATNLQQVQGQTAQQTQETVMQGMTPGSAPGAPVENSAADMYQEFQDLLTAQAAPDFVNLDRGEQQRIEARYFELLDAPEIQDQHGGQTRPTMDWAEMQQTVRDLARRVNEGMTNRRPNQAI